MFQHLLGLTRRGALVLLLVSLLSVLAFAGTNNAPVATSVSAYTSGSSTLITIYGTAPMAYSVSRPDTHTIMVNLPGVDASRLEASYMVTSPLVKSVVVERELHSPDNITTRMRVLLLAPARDRSQLATNNLVLELTPVNAADVPSLAQTPATGDENATQQQNPQAKPTPTPRPNVNITSAQNTQQPSQGGQYGQPGFVGEPINLNVVNADIRDILNYITEQYGVNFVIDSSVTAVPVTVNVTDVPWNIALDAILRANRLGVDANGNILRIATIEVLASETASQQRISNARLDNSQLVTEFIRLNYARGADTLKDAAGPSSGFTGGQTPAAFSATNPQGSPGSGVSPTSASAGDQGIIPIIRRRLSRRGSVEADARSNTLIITDVKENIDAIRQLVSLLDQPEPQVEIETRIVIANRNFSRDLGVQLSALALGANGRAGSFATLPGSTTTGGAGGGAQNTTGIVPNGIPNGIGQQPTNSLGANLASTVIGLTTGRIGTAQISALITAAESKGQAKIVATPRVTALNNRKAEISSGQQIPVVTPQTGAGNAGGTLIFTTTFVSVPLRLEVTPQITDAGTVVLRVLAENNSINTAVAINGTPGIDTQRMETEVLVPDGGTTVVGGVLADNESEIQNRTPGLASIPLVGNLFKRKAITRQTNEILFFITPRIYRPDYQGRPTVGENATGMRSTSIMQPVPLGNPPSNTPTQLEQQQAVPQTPVQVVPNSPMTTAPGTRP
jgi:type IV pilus assembly protein PilQ